MDSTILKSKTSFFMKEAIKEAQKALSKDEVPIGAVVVYKNKIIARAHNQVETLKDPTAHAEMIVLTQGCNYLSNKWLSGCTLYVTIEPCSMCAGALVLSRIEKVVFGADDPKAGACGSVINIVNDNRLNHKVKIERGLLKQECSLILKDFFRKKRAAMN